MKCPKCKYVSFEYLDECRKCGRDLQQHKETFGIYFPKMIPIDITMFLDKGNVNEDDNSVNVPVQEFDNLTDIDLKEEESSKDQFADAATVLSTDADEIDLIDFEKDEGGVQEEEPLSSSDTVEIEDVGEIALDSSLEIEGQEEEKTTEIEIEDTVDEEEDSLELEPGFSDQDSSPEKISEDEGIELENLLDIDDSESSKDNAVTEEDSSDDDLLDFNDIELEEE